MIVAAELQLEGREIMSLNRRSERVRLALTYSRARREREKAEAAAVIRSARVKTKNISKQIEKVSSLKIGPEDRQR